MSPLSMRQLAAESSTCQAIILNQQRYQHAKKTDTTPRWGQFSFYDGGGFVADLGYDSHTGFSIIISLQINGWLERKTRVVLAECSRFNPSVNMKLMLLN